MNFTSAIYSWRQINNWKQQLGFQTFSQDRIYSANNMIAKTKYRQTENWKPGIDANSSLSRFHSVTIPKFFEINVRKDEIP